MPTIYLLRHCRYANPRNILPGRLPVELSEEGKIDAGELKIFFANKNIHRIYSSAVLRCKQTAEIISNGQIPVVFDQRLLETFSAYQGFWDKNTPDGNDEFYRHLPELGGESFADTQRRVANFWQEVAAQAEENMLICSHGDPLISLYYFLKNLPLPSEMTPDTDLVDFLQKGECWEVQLSEGKVVGEIRKVIQK